MTHSLLGFFMSRTTHAVADRVSRSGVTTVAASLICCFLALFFYDEQIFSNLVSHSFNWSAQYFGLFWQILLLANFAIALFVATRPSAGRRLGNLTAPEFPLFQWIAMVLCTLLAGGGVFWAAAEPVAHFVSPPALI
jgi:glycine betaine transporter